jgi:hypothetical protein
MNYPEYVKVGDKQYKINTDFRIAIKCDQIARDENIGDVERALAIIYTLFGKEALNDSINYEKLLELAKKYLVCGKEVEVDSNEEPDMDFVEDMDYIEASFMSDYNIDLNSIEMHWWKFSNLINGLSNSEFGNCCVLNRIRNLRNFDTKEIKDRKERERIEKAKKQVALKRNKKEAKLTKEQEESMNELNKMLGL